MSSEYFPPIRAGLAAVAGTMAYNFDGALSASIVRHQRPWRPPSNDNTSDSIPTLPNYKEHTENYSRRPGVHEVQ